MFLKKGIFTVHMRAVEKAVSVDDVVPERLVNVGRVIVFFILDVVLVRWDILLHNFCGWSIFLTGFITVLGGSFILLFSASVAFIEGLLETAQLVI